MKEMNAVTNTEIAGAMDQELVAPSRSAYGQCQSMSNRIFGARGALCGITRRLLARLLVPLFMVVAPVLLHAGPVITSISPPSVAAGGPGFFLSMNGNGFTATQTALVNGIARPVSFES